MIHPATQLRAADPQRGYGVVASGEIPRGALVWVLDPLDVVIPADSPLLRRAAYALIVDAYTFEIGDGSRLLHWDIAKYVNHSCEANVVTSRWGGFSIAVRRIRAGEEITDDYGLYHSSDDPPMVCRCGSRRCRGVIAGAPTGARLERFGALLGEALADAREVEQPLLGYMEPEIHGELLAYLREGGESERMRRWFAGA